MRAVVVTSDPESLADIRRSWEGEGIQTEVLTAVEGACRAIEQGRADLVVLDGTLPRGDALALHAALRARGQGPTLPIIFRTSASGDYFIPPDAGPDALAALGRGILRPPGSLAPNPSANRRGAAPERDGQSSRHGGSEGGAILAAYDSPRRAPRARARALRGRAERPGVGEFDPVRVGGGAALAPTARGRRTATAGPEMTILPFLLHWSWLLVITTLLGLAG